MSPRSAAGWIVVVFLTTLRPGLIMLRAPVVVVVDGGNAEGQPLASSRSNAIIGQPDDDAERIGCAR